jgi:N-acetylglucosaminyldiphosphoundecaprenol N-acetyl-beta-D-mannosaminyltransferase
VTEPADGAPTPNSGVPRSLPGRHRVLGLPVSAVDLDATVALAVESVGRRLPLRIVVMNHSKCRLAVRNPALRTFLDDAELVVAESSMVWAARILGLDGIGAAWGVALMDALLQEAEARGWTVYLVGARPPVLADLLAKIRRERPSINVVGAHHGYLAPDDEERIRADLREVRPDLFLVAMGSPKQEEFMASLDPSLGPAVSLGVGGSFDVHAGHIRDAPGWIRGSGLEWLFRACLSPRLFKRYAVVLPWFVLAVARQRLTGRAPR